MSKQKIKAYERLKELHEEADSATYKWTSNGKSIEWKQNVQSALRRLYGEESSKLEAFNNVRYSPMMFTTGTPDRVFHESFLNGIKRAQAIIRSAIQEYEDYELEDRSKDEPSNTLNENRKIFVVHGHDHGMKEAVARFLEKLSFEVVILQEQANMGKTIIEKFERNSDVSFAVVLLSPDDFGNSKNKDDELQPRARQNVILELGYFVGEIGRSRVFPLVKGPLEVPSDYHGVVYVPFEETEWKMKLVKELKEAGFKIDANKAF